jgi:methyl-accepting chemotaxis protein
VAQNASAVEKSAAAADAMRIHAAQLVDVVGKFKLSEQPGDALVAQRMRGSTHAVAQPGAALPASTAGTTVPATRKAGDRSPSVPAGTAPDADAWTEF